MANMAGRDPIRTLAHATGLCRGARYFWARGGGGPRWCAGGAVLDATSGAVLNATGDRRDRRW